MVNRVMEENLDDVAEHLSSKTEELGPVYVLKEEPALNFPTVGTVARTLKARFLTSKERGLNREVRLYKVAAMQLRNFLGHIEDGVLIITPGDRADVILGTLITLFSEKAARIAGLILTGGLEPEPPVMRLIEGLEKPCFPIMSVKTDTYTTAMNVNSVHSTITAGNERKIALALGVFESRVDLAELEQRIAVARSDRVTPLMFEYELIDRAKSERKHIVLPEGGEERILRAAEILQHRGTVDLTLLGNIDEIKQKVANFGLDLREVKIIDPHQSYQHEDFAKTYFQLRGHKGITMDQARDVMMDVSYFGTMMIHHGLADGMVSGSTHTTQHTLRPAFEFIRSKPGFSIVSSVFFMCLADRVPPCSASNPASPCCPTPRVNPAKERMWSGCARPRRSRRPGALTSR